MGRIRSIKPEFFLHEELFDLEMATGLPVRLAFAGLWCQADREGRFKWKPRTLKSQVLPFDECDFSRVLDALTTRGFVVKYVSEGEEFGFIPSFPKHQVINNREKDSELPAPPVTVLETDPSTRGARVPDALPARGQDGKAEGKGKEHGRERKGEGGARGDFPAGLSNHPAVILYWQRFHPEELPAIGSQDRIEKEIGTDLVGWSRTLDFWEQNQYRPESIGKMLDRYLEERAKGPSRLTDLTPSGNPRITAPG